MTKKEIYSIVREIMARHHDNSNRNDLASQEISESIHNTLNNIPSSADINLESEANDVCQANCSPYKTMSGNTICRKCDKMWILADGN